MRKRELLLLETERLHLQSDIDSTKSSLERNRLGQFATPPALANEILRYSLSLLPQGEPVRFLDPAFGTGAFYSALLNNVTPGRQISVAMGVEIDPYFGQQSVQLWRKTNLQLEIADFTQCQPPLDSIGLSNLVVCNPPYVRHHHLSSVDKQRIGRMALLGGGVRISGLAGLYAYFLLIAHSWMAQSGVAAWLIPSEFMDVNYGKGIKAYLTEKVTLLRVHRFKPEDVQFTDALVTSTVVWFQNDPPPETHVVTFTSGGSLSDPSTITYAHLADLRSQRKWSVNANGKVNSVEQSDQLSSFFKIKRGLATGSNKFFILSEEKTQELQLPSKFLRPVLPGPRFVLGDEIPADSSGNPITEPKLFLIDANLPEAAIRDRYPELWQYLEEGKKDVSSRYLCTHRKPWYSQETREPSPFLCTYIGRSDSKSGNPFRFMLNNSKAVATNVYLMLYPKDKLKEFLERKPEAKRDILKILNGIGPDSLKEEGRVYGGGLHKLEPKELARVPAKALDQYLLDSNS